MSIRSSISLAAFSVKVRARISLGWARFSAISHLTRSVTTVVFAGAGAGDDEKRAGFVRNCLKLLFV